MIAEADLRAGDDGRQPSTRVGTEPAVVPHAMLADPACRRDLRVQTSHAAVAVRQSAGRGLPVLFLHGVAASKDVFAGQFDSGLAGTYRFMALDFPGHGASGDAVDPASSYSVPGYADAVVEVLDHLGIDQVVVVGWSLGGHVALELVAAFPGVVGVLVTGAPPVGRGLAALRQAFGPSALGKLTGETVSGEEPRDASRALSGEAPLEGRNAAVRSPDRRARSLTYKSVIEGRYADEKEIVETSMVPIAVVSGADDPIVDADYLRGLHYANLWRRTCHVLPRAGHRVFLDAAPVFNRLLASFLADMDARARDLIDNPPLCYAG